MGSELLGEDTSPNDRVGVGKASTLSYTEIFWKCLPSYLAMGMTAEEFWNCDPLLYKAYREKQKISLELENQQMWLNGMYIYQAILLAAPRLNFIRPRKPDPYPKQPFSLSIGKETAQASPMMNDKGFAKVAAWASRVNQKIGKKE